ncbi:NADH-quinone oxidoreductase subunit L [Caenispirillum salinarum]|uniref:NADH-quinone oxidoreductase subunit 5 family protein n=1 Tax=Caenispirillum salinarum TaxID=859058 RepID=UPI00384D55B7
MLWTLALLPALIGAGVIFAGGGRSRLVLGLVGGGTMAATLVLAVAAVAGGWSGVLVWSDALRLTAALTPVSAAVALLVPLIALPILVYASAHEHRPGLSRLIGLLLVFVGGMELLVIADDLLTLLIGWELVGACSWALIGHDWRVRDNPRSGLYAFVVTRFGDLGLFAAAMALYAGTGGFGYDRLADLEGPLLHVAAFGVLLSAAAKSGQVPFAPWLFRAMAGPTSVSALLHAAAMVAAGAYLLARLQPELAPAAGWSGTVIAVGLATALAGGVVACLQPHAKKLLAASTSAHYGLMFVAVGAGYPAVAALHLIAHAAFKALLFLAAGSAGEQAETFALHRLGMGRVLPVMAALSAVGALALAGIPPLGAGFTKDAVVAAAGHLSPWLAGGVMLAGGLSAAYAARFHLLAYGRSREAPEAPPKPLAERAAAGVLAALTLALSVLWLPGAARDAGRLMGMDIPHAPLWEVIVSVLLIGLGLLVGTVLARRYSEAGTTGAPARAAAWLGLPALLREGVARPFERLAAFAGTVDDRVIDALPRLVARLGRWLASVIGRGDRRVVDAGVRATARFGEWLAGMSDRIGEAVTDGLPEGTARLVSFSGTDARRLQTGMSHHYYALLAGGAVLVIVTIIALS